MITPGCDAIVKLAERYATIPVCREIYADMVTPIALLRRLQARSRRFFLLESVEGGEKWARYSFLGYDPVLRARCKNGVVTIEGAENRTIQTAKPLDVLRELLGKYRAPRIEGLPPFTGGFVGYFAYAMLGYAEPKLRIRRGAWEDFDLLLFDKVIAYDHLRQKLVLVVNMSTDSVMENYGKACAELENMAALVNDQSPLPPLQAAETPCFSCSITEEQYAAVVRKTREYIYNGDIFQAVQSRQFTSPYTGSLLPAYRVLRTTNPSPYMVFLSIDGDEIMCSSPETLVRLQDGRLTTFPVAGSRPRGATPAEDKTLERELLADEKELSEHNMLVDLGRNDLGRVSADRLGGGDRLSDDSPLFQDHAHLLAGRGRSRGRLRRARRASRRCCPRVRCPARLKSARARSLRSWSTTPRGVYGGAHRLFGLCRATWTPASPSAWPAKKDGQGHSCRLAAGIVADSRAG